MSLTVGRGRFLQSIFPVGLPMRRGIARLELLTDDMRQRQSDEHANEELHIMPIDHPAILINGDTHCFLSIC